MSTTTATIRTARDELNALADMYDHLAASGYCMLGLTAFRKAADMARTAADNLPPEPDTLGRLHNIADDYERDTLTELARRAGMLWLCDCEPGGWDNREDEAECGRCGKSKPDPDDIDCGLLDEDGGSGHDPITEEGGL